MSVCFIGHRYIERTKDLISSLKKTIIFLMEKGETTFLFGSKSEFNKLAWEVVTQLKEKNSFINRVYVRSNFQDINKDYEEYLLNFFEKTYFPYKLKDAGKRSYIERNFEMIDKATYCIFYFDNNYLPPLKYKTAKSTRKSGTKIAYNYALKKGKRIINLYKRKELTKVR